MSLGACCIEKHFTLDKTLDGPDHMLSADPAELSEMIRGIRQLEQSLGDGLKRLTPGERRNKPNNRKSVVAVIDVPAGTPLTRDMIDVKRPGDGIPPKYLEQITSRTARVDIPAETSLTWNLLR